MNTSLRYLVGIVVLLLLVSCWGHTSDENDETVKKAIAKSLTTDNDSIDEEKPTIGQYVYMDRTGCLHLRQDCYSFSDNDQLVLSTETNDESAESSLDIKSSRYALHRISVKGQLKEGDLNFCCSGCINDSIFNLLVQATYKNISDSSSYSEYRVPRPAKRHLNL